MCGDGEAIAIYARDQINAIKRKKRCRRRQNEDNNATKTRTGTGRIRGKEDQEKK